MRAVRRRTQPLPDGLHAALQALVLLHTLTAVVLGADMCTKAVVVRSEPSKKVHVLRRVPASCSNWEKAWSWITKKDCGTKYKLDLVDIPHSRLQYKVVKTCCEGDTKCKEAEADGLESSGLDVSDEKFLAIVLGSTAAALFVLILVITISLCRKKKQCSLLCEERRHIYASAEDEADESSELQGQKGCGARDEDETENKVCESEYAEINDSSLPRYTDIFKEAAPQEDPFTRATAPPICTVYEPCPHSRSASEESARCSKARGGAGPDPHDSNVKEVLQGTADILQREGKQQPKSQQKQPKPPSHQKQPKPPSQHKQPTRAPAAKGKGPADYCNVAAPSRRKEAAVQGQGQGQWWDLVEAGPGSPVGATTPTTAALVREEAVLSLTKDDPAVVTVAGRASSSSSSSSASASTAAVIATVAPLVSAAPPPPIASSCAGKSPSQPASRAGASNVYHNCDVTLDGTVQIHDRKEQEEEEPPLPPPAPSPPLPGHSSPGQSPGGPRKGGGGGRLSASEAYETLARGGDGKDGHEYQPLVSRKGRHAPVTRSRARRSGRERDDDDNAGDVSGDDEESSFVTANGRAEEEDPLEAPAAMC